LRGKTGEPVQEKSQKSLIFSSEVDKKIGKKADGQMEEMNSGISME